LFGRSAEERAVRRVVEGTQTAVLTGLNRRTPNVLDTYFATVEEGAQSGGLAETQQAYQAFMEQLPANTSVQFHSFDITGVEVHEEGNLARVTYRLHFSVTRGGIAFFSARATQNLALLKTPRGWRISGGDTAQLADVVGTWPPQ
jgi:ketosteroid isomerase-like protein